MLDLHFPRHQERANLHVGRRLRLAHLFNRCRPVLFEVGSERKQEILVEAERELRNIDRVADHSGLMFANFTTLPHFSVSSAISLPNSAGEPGSTAAPKSAKRALIIGSAMPAFTSRLSISITAAGVFFGTPKPSHALAS